MKKLFTLVVISLCSLLLAPCSNAQGNLQFNQVYTYSGFLTQGGSSPILTVPDGKVWKVEYFTIDWFVLNHTRTANPNNNGGPLWLKPGDIIYYSGPVYNVCCGGTTNYLISIIEFNVVP